MNKPVSKPMSKPAFTVMIYGWYVILFLALPFLFVPQLILPLAGMAAPTDVWVRVLGMTVVFLGFFYLQMARYELTAFFRMTVFTRLCVPVFFLAFVLLGLAPPVLLAFCIPDILFSTWTALALRGAASVSKQSITA